MKKHLQQFIPFIIFISFVLGTFAQNEDSLPYREITDYPDSYTAANLASRMVDGLGFRFYWTTDGLRKEDLAFRPTKEARNVDETIDHILSMTTMLVNSIQQVSEKPEVGLSFEAKRTLVLHQLKTASDILRQGDDQDLENYTIKLGKEESLPFWSFVNGQIADCIWHCGQISSFRRLSGNPINAKVSFLRGAVRD